jgi:rsbT co-antagonist protein RsbR
MSETGSEVVKILKNGEAALLADWLIELRALKGDSRISENELAQQARDFLRLLAEAAAGNLFGADSAPGSALTEFLAGVSRSRALQGFSSMETALFVFSLKKPVFDQLRKALAADGTRLAEDIWKASELLDRLGMFTVDIFQKSREDVIRRQQEEMLELSTPVVKLWDGVLALPMIGTLDSTRTQLVMESLLQRIVDTGSEIAIIDITGVPTVDTLVAQHLLKTVTAIRLMGADCILSGIRPQIAQTIVHLGIDLEGIVSKATLADALAVALKRSGYTFTKQKA